MPAVVMIWAVAAPLGALTFFRRVPRNLGRQPLRHGRLAVLTVCLAIMAAKRE